MLPESGKLIHDFPGLYPESHGIVGNQFYDSEVHKMTDSTYLAFFNIDDERTTAHMKWWQKVTSTGIFVEKLKQN